MEGMVKKIMKSKDKKPGEEMYKELIAWFESKPSGFKYKVYVKDKKEIGCIKYANTEEKAKAYAWINTNIRDFCQNGLADLFAERVLGGDDKNYFSNSILEPTIYFY